MKVLIADDEADSRHGLELAVRSLGHSCVVARDGLEAWEMHRTDRVDVILSDWRMPRLDGIGLCKRVRSEPGAPYTHFIFVTGSSDKAHYMEGMHAGADDYITKPVDLDELDARLEASRRVVLVQRRGSTRIPAVRAEPLTIPACRQEFAEDLETLASRVRRHTYCVAICNIDAFSSYNDCSDDVLGTVAETIRAALRPGDGFYRYGEDEFLAILTDQSLAEAAAGMDRVRREVAELHVVHSAQGSVPFVTLSVGIAELLPDSPCGIDDWLRQADFALYRAKAHHGNRVVVESQAEAHRLDAAAAR